MNEITHTNLYLFLDNKEGLTKDAILTTLPTSFKLFVGFLNGVGVALIKVPSLIITLGTMAIIRNVGYVK